MAQVRSSLNVCNVMQCNVVIGAVSTSVPVTVFLSPRVGINCCNATPFLYRILCFRRKKGDNWEHSGREAIPKFLLFRIQVILPQKKSKIQFEFLARKGSREAFFSLWSQYVSRQNIRESKWGLKVLVHNCPRLPTIVVIL